MPALSPGEIEILRLVSVHAYKHQDLPLPQRLHMGRLLSEGYVRIAAPNTWEITASGEAILAVCVTLN